MGGGWVVGGWVLDFTRLMLISTQVEVGVEVGVELGNRNGGVSNDKKFVLPVWLHVAVRQYVVGDHREAVISWRRC